jgi:two-component system capsular synthesis response regulator RcsB
MNKLVQIAIADDHPVVLEALEHELNKLPGFTVSIQAETGEALLAALAQNSCEVVISDFTMQAVERGDESDGFGLISQIRQQYPATRLIVYTAMSNSAVVKRLYRMGTFSVISKKEKTSELIAAVKAFQEGKQVYFPSSLRGELELSWAQGEAFTQTKELTISEMEVVRLFVGGCSLGDICDRLARTPSTISTHKNNAMRKLGLNTDADLIKYAYATSLI